VAGACVCAREAAAVPREPAQGGEIADRRERVAFGVDLVYADEPDIGPGGELSEHVGERAGEDLRVRVEGEDEGRVDRLEGAVVPEREAPVLARDDAGRREASPDE